MTCDRSFVRSSRPLVTWTDFVAFSRFVRGRINREHVLSVRSWSRPTLSIRFGLFLNHPIPASVVWQILPPTTAGSSTPWVHGCDGKWLGRVGVFFIHRNVTTKENLWWSFMKSESYDAISHDIRALAEYLKNHLPQGAVSDWKGAIVSAVSSHFGEIPHQRCLAHVKREAKRLLPKHSGICDPLICSHVTAH